MREQETLAGVELLSSSPKQRTHPDTCVSSPFVWEVVSSSTSLLVYVCYFDIPIYNRGSKQLLPLKWRFCSQITNSIASKIKDAVNHPFRLKKSSNICLYYVSSPLRLLSSVNSLSSRAKKNRRFFLENVYWILDIGWWIVDWIGFKYPQVSHRLRSPAWYWMILDIGYWMILVGWFFKDWSFLWDSSGLS